MKNIKLLGLDKTYKQWLTLMAIFMGGGTIYKLAYIRDVYYTQMMAATGATNVQMGLMMTAFAATCVFCFLPGGWLVDLFPAKYLVSAGLIITGIAGLVEATLPPMKVILVIQGIYGISTTLLFWESMFKGVRLLGNKNEQGRLFGILEGGRGITGTVISFISLAVYAKLGSDKLGMRGAMFVYAIALIIFGLIALFMMEKNEVEGRVDAIKALKGLGKVCTLPKVWIAGCIVWMGYASYNGLSYFSPYLVKVLGVSQTATSAISIVRTYLFAIICAPIAGMIADKMGSRINFLKYVFALGTIMCAATIVLSVLDCGIGVFIFIMLVVAAIILAMRGTYYSTTAEIGIPIVLSGAALGLISQLGNAPDLYISALYGWFLDAYPGKQGYLMVFGTMAVQFLIACILCIVLHGMNKRDAANNKKVVFDIEGGDVID
ncbi:MFS transporter [Sediminispirochaeta smaragdinae]|uniref:Major facilitator superfamily MFS_1 n=1 Tax=Sediminispirochaeta smaragdinae (strain DSM 11293 / JCM 15392 / SEBR 4228) TaxID=573413 RepID=E1RAJ0_SEDSS|nr:MFS transporter [Sediminispirochaeta smaragdinae]ADK82358.1 major facilitator superfamily MFS_1 [Sediminispirochaeta smaragdinae DSM 11293]